MLRLTELILTHAKGLPEGTPVAAKSLLHLGNRAAVDQALSRLAERGQLIRAGRGVYLRPLPSRFGMRTPSIEQAVEALATQRGEVIVSNGAAAANTLGLTTQVHRSRCNLEAPSHRRDRMKRLPSPRFTICGSSHDSNASRRDDIHNAEHKDDSRSRGAQHIPPGMAQRHNTLPHLLHPQTSTR